MFKEFVRRPGAWRPGLLAISLTLALTLQAAAQAPVASPSPPAAKPSPAAGPPVLTLEEALQLAHQDNRKLANARLEVDKNHDLLVYNERQRLPNFSVRDNENRLLTPLEFQMQAGTLGSFPATGPIPARDVTLSRVTGAQNTFKAVFTQPLSQLHVIGLQVGAAQDEMDVAVQGTRAQSQNLTTQVKQVYYDMVDTQNGIGAVRENLEFYQELLRVTKEYLKEQTRLKSDLLQVQAELKNQEYNLVSLENNLAQEREQMNILLARDISTPFQVQDPSLDAGVNDTLESLQQEALSKRPELLQSRLKEQESETNREIKRAQYVPDVSLDLLYIHQSNSGLLPPSTAMVMLRAEWDAIDFGRRDAQIAAADKVVQEAQKSVEDTQAQVLSDVNTKFRNLAALKAQEAAKAASVEYAEEAQRVTLNRFLQKTALTKEVLEAQAKLTQARREYKKLQLDISEAVAQLYQAVGRD